jgi:flavin-dependent dehydrogenase
MLPISLPGRAFFLVGDAACFLDPLLSTGFHLAAFYSLLSAACLISLNKGEIEEEESIRFFDTAYRYAYLRLLALVSAFYQQHSETDSYFREAQKLSQVDYGSKEIMQAFIGIISSVEDLEDVQRRGVDQERLLQRLGELVRESPATLTREGITPTPYEIERAHWTHIIP